MFFIGQPQIVDELNYILPHLYDTGEGYNFLLRAPSGFGKTHLAKLIANYIVGREYQYTISSGEVPSIYRRVAIIDECHLIKDPEPLYPIMDSKENVIIFCTNESSKLKEPLVNRCTTFVFGMYDDDSLIEMVMKHAQFGMSIEDALYIVHSGNRNPRIVIGITNRLNLIARGVSIDVRYSVENILGIVDGLDVQMREYLSFLRRNSPAALQTICRACRIGEDTARQIEGVLIQRDMLVINSRGRSIK